MTTVQTYGRDPGAYSATVRHSECNSSVLMKFIFLFGCVVVALSILQNANTSSSSSQSGHQHSSRNSGDDAKAKSAAVLPMSDNNEKAMPAAGEKLPPTWGQMGPRRSLKSDVKFFETETKMHMYFIIYNL